MPKNKNKNKNNRHRGNLSTVWLIDDAGMQQLKDLYSNNIDERTMDGLDDASSVGGGTEIQQPVINVHGPLLPRSDVMTRFFGVTTYQDIAEQLSVLESDLDEGADVYLDVDSGGGNGAMLFPLCERIRESKLNTIAYVSGRAASAAYVLAAACDHVHMDETSEVGGLGVRTGYSMDEDKPKNMIISTHSPSKDADKAEAQASADKLENIMYSRLHQWRGPAGELYDIEKTAEAFGNGKMLFGDDAKEQRMADEVLTSSPYNYNKEGDNTLSTYNEKQLQEKVDEATKALKTELETKLTTAENSAKTLADDIHARYEAVLSTDAGKANPSEALKFAKDTRFSLEEAEDFLKKLAPAGKANNKRGDEAEDVSDPLAEAIEKSGGTANLSTLQEQQQELKAKKPVLKEENKLLGVAKYGSRSQDTYKLMVGEYEGGRAEYDLRWAEVETEKGE